MIRAVLAATAAVAAVVGVYRAGPPPGHTGAFGEPDCAACHFDAITDDEAGSLTIDAPAAYHPGRPCTVTLRLTHPGLVAGGFQLTARHLDGDMAGRQAGTLEPMDARTRVERTGNGVVYASHTGPGVVPGSAHGGGAVGSEAGSIEWTVRWTPPDSGGAVALDVAAQVSNDDASEFGERLYRVRQVVPPDQ